MHRLPSSLQFRARAAAMAPKRKILIRHGAEMAKVVPAVERIRLHAYMLYVHSGRNNGHALDDWIRSEAEILGTAPAMAIEISPVDIESTQREYEQSATDADSVYGWLVGS